MTMIFVTHDQEEAMRISDRVFVLEAGRVAQSSSAEALYQNPEKPFVADFVGNYNRFEWFELEQYSDEAEAFSNQFAYYLRPELIRLENKENSLVIPVELKETFILGNIQRYVFTTENQKEIIVDRLNDHTIKPISRYLYVAQEDILKIPIERRAENLAEQS